MSERAEFVDRWADALAERLDKSPDELRSGGLSAYDFDGGDVIVQWQDDSTARFRYAFFVKDPSRAKIAIFTEHCGYMEIDSLGVESISEAAPT